MEEITWKWISDSESRAFVGTDYRGFVAKHGSWRVCVFTKPYTATGKNEYVYEYGSGRSKSTAIAWAEQKIKETQEEFEKAR